MAEIEDDSNSSRSALIVDEQVDQKDGANESIRGPLQLVRLVGGKLELVEETAKFLSGFQGPIVVIGITGIVGSGKSFLLNRFHRAAGFIVGEATKGIWVYIFPCKGKQGEDCMTVLLDTEGLGVKQEGNYDATLFALTATLSSFIIFNSCGDIDERAILQLHFILNLPSCITSSDDFKRQPPPFIWVLRDNTKTLNNDYMEQQLGIKEGIEINIQTCNFITRRVTNHFRDRACFSLPPPVSVERSGELASATAETLDSSFVEKTNELVATVLHKASVKTITRTDSTGARKTYTLNCSSFVVFAREYINRINSSDALSRLNTPRKASNSPRREKTPRMDGLSPRGKKESSVPVMQRSMDSVDIQLKINAARYEQELQDMSKQKGPLHKGESVTVQIPQQKNAEEKNGCAVCGGTLTTIVVYARYAIGALIVFAIVIGLIVYFTKND